jgi:hypothetical protein
VNETATKFHRIPNSSEFLEQDILVQFIHKPLKIFIRLPLSFSKAKFGFVDG